MCEKLENLSNTIDKILDYKEIVSGETNTRRVLIDPILCNLGYDTSNPYEVINEYTCDFGVKKGEKVDYALFKDAELTILVEAKSIEVELNVEHISQLYRYFSVTNAQIGVLTNGLDYWFFTDRKDKNKMDDKPFFNLNIENLRDGDIDKLLLFHRDEYDIELIKSVFGNLAIRDDIRYFFLNQANTLDEDLSDLIQGKLNIQLNKLDFSKVLQNQLKSLLGIEQVNKDVRFQLTLNTKYKDLKRENNVKLRDVTSQVCTGSKIERVTIEYTDYEVKSWSDAIFTLVNHLAINNNDIEWIDKLDGTLSENKGFIRKNNDKFLKCSAIGSTGLYLDTHGSSYMHVQRMKVICRNAKLPLDKVQLWLV